MNRTSALPFAAALLVILIGAAGSLLAGGSWETALIAILAGAFALIIVTERRRGEAAAQTDETQAPLDLLDNPDFAKAMEGIIEPLLIVANDRVARANRAALRLLGSPILGEDVRLAIRNPAAAARLPNPREIGSTSCRARGCQYGLV